MSERVQLLVRQLRLWEAAMAVSVSGKAGQKVVGVRLVWAPRRVQGVSLVLLLLLPLLLLADDLADEPRRRVDVGEGLELELVVVRLRRV